VCTCGLARAGCGTCCTASSVSRGLAEQQHDQFGLPVCQAEHYRQMLLKDVDRGAALRELTSWLTTRDPTAPDSIGAASGALTIAEWAAEGRDWPGVIQLVRTAEPILTLAGHWEASRQALTHGLHAAVAAADHLSEALFSHQQGTLALCLDELSSAQQLLSHALRLREQHGDHDGAEVTRHNLEILRPPAVKAARPRPRSPRKLLAIAGSGALAVLAITSFTGDRDGVDLDQVPGPGQGRHAYQRVGGLVLPEQGCPGLFDHRQVLGPVMHDEDRYLGHLVEASAPGGHRPAEVGEHLAGLGGQVTGADEVALRVLGFLAGDEHHLAARRDDHVGVGGRRWQAVRVDELVLH
jgi:hypothetical protein